MSTALTAPQYPFDPTGAKPSNRIVGELQPLTGVGDRDYYTVVPLKAPFYADTLSLRIKALNGEIRPLVEGVDYYTTHKFQGASLATAKPVYGSITFLNTQLRGTLIFDPYQCVGGDWTVDDKQIVKVLADQVHNPRSVTWEQIVAYPNIFPPVPHEWNLTDMVGMKEIVAALDRIMNAVLVRISDEMARHINDKAGHAHGITAASIGAITKAQLDAAVALAIEELTRTTDDLQEGTENKFFTEPRVMQSHLAGYLISNVVAVLGEGDTLLEALTKLQAQITANTTNITKKANALRPAFDGLGSQNLVKMTLSGPALAIDITKAEAFQIRIQANGAIGFNISALGNMDGRVVEFSVTTVNDSTGNVYAVAWPANVKWVDNVPPPRSTAANARDSWYFWSEDNGVSWVGSLSNKNPG